MRNLLQRALALAGLADLLQPVALLALRLYVSSVFFRAGVIKISDWGATLALFRDEYKVPLLPPEVAAGVGAFGELTLPVLIALGLMGRVGAAGLFVVNAMAVIAYPQLWDFDCPAGLHMHFVWGAILLLLALFGPGKLSLDELILTRLGLRPASAA